MFRKEFHLFDFPPSKIYVKLKEEFNEKLYEESLKMMRSDELAKILSRRSKEYGIRVKVRPWHLKCYREKNSYPLWVIIELSKLTTFSPEEIEQQVISYGGRSKLRVQPKGFPIPHSEKIDFVSGIASSSFRHPKRRIAVKKHVGMLMYEMLKEILGEFKVKIDPSHVTFPSVVTHILERIHPTAGLNEPKKNITAYILGVFTNKGYVAPSYIEINKKDEKFLSHVSKLLTILGCKSILSKDGYSLRFSKSSSVYFAELVEELHGLSFSPYHESLVKKRIKREKAARITSVGRKRSILRVLEERPKTVAEISSEIGLSYTRTYEYVKEMEDDEAIKIVGRKKRGRRYSKLYSQSKS